ncbi:MAG: hypothetical protein VX416_16180, partial [Pseudomonadota bacterium]|nr:hypothetical protein [Pseudomonadota bacterium]
NAYSIHDRKLHFHMGRFDLPLNAIESGLCNQIQKTHKHKNNDYLYKFDNVLNKVLIYNIFEIKHIFYLNIEYFIRFT